MDVRVEAIRRRKRVVLLLVSLGIVAALIFLFRAVLAPFLVAIFFGYLIDPVVERMAGLRLFKRFRLGRGGSIVIIYLFLILCLYLVALFTVPAFDRQIRQARTDLPKVRVAAEEWAQGVVDWYRRVANEGPSTSGTPGAPGAEDGGDEQPGDVPEEPPPDQANHYRITIKGGGEFVGKVSDQSVSRIVLRYGDRFLVLDREDVEAMEPIYTAAPRFDLLKLLRKNIDQLTLHLDSALVVAIDVGRIIVKALYMIVLIMMITAFLVIDRPRIVQFFHSIPPERNRETWQRLTQAIDRGLAGVIRGQLLIMLVNGILTWIGLQFLGVRYAVLLGVVAGTFSIIPIFGTILSTIPIVLIAWGTSGWYQAILALAWILLIHFVEANFLNPKIMGSASKIHPVVVIFALIAGEYAYGIAGALLAVPAASILQSCFRFFVIDRQLEAGGQAQNDELATESAKSALQPAESGDQV